MKYKIEFETKQSVEVLKNETLAYFESQGFKVITNDPNLLQFKRGSIVGNMTAFNPLKWKSEISVRFINNKVVANFDINTKHQMVSAKEEGVWKNFVSNFQNSIETGESYQSANEDNIKDAQKSTWGYIGYALIGAVLFAIPGFAIAYYTEIRSAVSMAAIGGAMIFMRYKMAKDERGISKES